MGIHVAPRSVDSFIGDVEPMKSPESTNDLTMCVYVHSIRDLPKMDLIKGSADPYCLLSYIGRDEPKVKSRTIYNNLNPFIDSDLRIPIILLATDVLRVSVMNSDDSGKDDQLNTSQIHLRTHISNYGEPVFLFKPFVPQYIYVFVDEAADIPKIDFAGKNDCYAKISTKGSVIMDKTRPIDNSLTPQWFQQFMIVLNDHMTDSLYIELYDDGIKDTKFSTSEIHFNKHGKDLIHSDWFDLDPIKDKNSGERVHLRF